MYRDQDLFELTGREMARTSYPEELPALPSIPAGRYHDPAFFELEQEYFFKRTWLWAAHVSELPEPGSYKLFTRFGTSIIVIRDEHGEIRALRNSCRHRGAALLTKPSGTARRLVCPYHAWAFSPQGKLVTVPEERDFCGLDKSSLSLPTVRVETWKGFVFINFDQNAAPLADFMAPLDEAASRYDLDDIHVKGVVAKEVDCNWKVAYDNSVEAYHVRSVHRATIAPIVETRSNTQFLLHNGHGFNATRLRDPSIFRDKETRAKAKLDSKASALQISIIVFPNIVFVPDPSGISWLTIWPVSPGKCQFVSTLLGPVMPTAERETEYREQLRSVLEEVIAEDLQVLDGIQRSIACGNLENMVLSSQERGIRWYNEHIDRVIGADRIPPELHVAPVLSSHLGQI